MALRRALVAVTTTTLLLLLLLLAAPFAAATHTDTESVPDKPPPADGAHWCGPPIGQPPVTYICPAGWNRKTTGWKRECWDVEGMKAPCHRSSCCERVDCALLRREFSQATLGEQARDECLLYADGKKPRGDCGGCADNHCFVACGFANALEDAAVAPAAGAAGCAAFLQHFGIPLLGGQIAEACAMHAHAVDAMAVKAGESQAAADERRAGEYFAIVGTPCDKFLRENAGTNFLCGVLKANWTGFSQIKDLHAVVTESGAGR
jgi:hypothetical protein